MGSYGILEAYASMITTKIDGCYSPEKEKIIEQLREKEKQKSSKAPTEFKFFDNRIDYKVDKDDIDFELSPEKDQLKEETKDVEPETPQSQKSEVIKPDQFRIGDDRIDFQVDPSGSDKFSETDQESVAESSQAEGLWDYAQKFDGDQNIAPIDPPEPQNSKVSYSEKSVQVMDEDAKMEDMRKMEERKNIKSLVDATISAWSANPSMVKKELDKQHELIRVYKDQIQDLQYQLSLRNQEFEKRAGIDSIRNLEKKKKELERQNVGSKKVLGIIIG